MGFKRKMGHVALCLTLLSGAGGAEAGTAPEPLIVTSLPDPEMHLVTTGSSSAYPALDGAMASFANAISQSALADERAARSQCNSTAAIPAAGAARMSWEANCRYRRR